MKTENQTVHHDYTGIFLDTNVRLGMTGVFVDNAMSLIKPPAWSEKQMTEDDPDVDLLRKLLDSDSHDNLDHVIQSIDNDED